MKKFILCLLCLLLVACSSDNSEKIALGRYEELISQLNYNTSFQSHSEYYDLSYETVKISDNEYRYYIFIDNARIAMYDIVALALSDGVDTSTLMQPSVGIFEDKNYTMIPNQVKKEAGFVEGLMLSGTVDDLNKKVKLLVEWYDKELLNRQVEYLEIDLLEQGGNNG